MPIEISGHSDDVVSIREVTPDGRSRADQTWEDELPPSRPILIGTPEAGVVVTMHYAPGKATTWASSVRQVGEGIPIPWPVTITEKEEVPRKTSGGWSARKSYTVLVSVACPCDTPVRCGKTRLPRS